MKSENVNEVTGSTSHGSFSFQYRNNVSTRWCGKKKTHERNAQSINACRYIPSMENINVIFRKIWPYVQFNYTNTYLQCLDDGNITAVTAELITGQIRVVSSVYKIVR